MGRNMGKLKNKLIQWLGGMPYTPYIAPFNKTYLDVHKVVSVFELRPGIPEYVVESGLKRELIDQIGMAGGIIYDRKVEDGFTKVYATALVCVKPNE